MGIFAMAAGREQFLQGGKQNSFVIGQNSLLGKISPTI